MKKVLVVGSTNIDIVQSLPHFPKPGETISALSTEIHFGGKGANQAYTLAKLGAKVHFLTSLGKDDFGSKVYTHLEKAGVQMKSTVYKKNVSTGSANIFLNQKGENIIVLNPGANLLMTKHDIQNQENLFQEIDILLLQLEISMEAIIESIRMAKKYEKMVIVNPAPFHKNILKEDIISLIDILIPNEIELAQMSQIKKIHFDNVKTAAQIMMDKGVKELYITLGENGAVFIDAHSEIFFPPKKINVIDTTGAGDTFIGATVAAISQNLSHKEIGNFATKAASLSITKIGAQSSIPNIDEINHYLF